MGCEERREGEKTFSKRQDKTKMMLTYRDAGRGWRQPLHKSMPWAHPCLCLQRHRSNDAAESMESAGLYGKEENHNKKRNDEIGPVGMSWMGLLKFNQLVQGFKEQTKSLLDHSKLIIIGGNWEQSTGCPCWLLRNYWSQNYKDESINIKNINAKRLVTHN